MLFIVYFVALLILFSCHFSLYFLFFSQPVYDTPILQTPCFTLHSLPSSILLYPILLSSDTHLPPNAHTHSFLCFSSILPLMAFLFSFFFFLFSFFFYSVIPFTPTPTYTAILCYSLSLRQFLPYLSLCCSAYVIIYTSTITYITLLL